jgi:1-deoxy-D-xylulose-5-phosphate synthase
MMYTAQLPDKATWVIRYPRGCGSKPDWHCDMKEITVGEGRLMYSPENPSPGKKRLAILTIGPVGCDAMQVAKEIGAAHYDMRFVKPIDEKILREVAENYDCIVTVEDGIRNGGMGSAVTEWMQDNGYTITVRRLGLPDCFVEHGTVSELKKIVGIDAESIKQTCLHMME